MNVALIGSGNAFFMDEGAGLYAGKYLKENYDFAPAIDAGAIETMDVDTLIALKGEFK